MEIIPCIICGGSSNTHFEEVQDRFTKDEILFKLVKCQCGLVYLNPRPTHKEINNYYNLDDYDPHVMKDRGLWKQVYKRVQSVTLYWKYRKIFSHKSSGIILDIGGGQGKFAHYMAEKKWNVYFQDEHTDLKRTTVYNKIQSYKLLKHIDDVGDFTVISLWHSLEHIHDIDYVMKYIYKYLDQDGVAAIAVPNLNAPERSILGRNWAPYDPPRHLYHFNLQSFESLCDKFKLKIIRKYSLYQDTPYNVLLSLQPLNLFKIVVAIFITLYSWSVTAIRGPQYSSSILVLCQRQ